MRICYMPRGTAEAYRSCLRRARDGPRAFTRCVALVLGSYVN